MRPRFARTSPGNDGQTHYHLPDAFHDLSFASPVAPRGLVNMQDYHFPVERTNDLSATALETEGESVIRRIRGHGAGTCGASEKRIQKSE
jgi:hypothetical protein